ncbi:MAG: S8 family serine peptidase [Acidobacteria bacterium]|nr:S8 family serine peptidase [Acidobacteriota bacterium]
MMKRLSSLFLVSLLLLFASAIAQGQGPPDGLPSGARVPNRYIVVVQEGVSPESVAFSYGVIPAEVYTSALNGFAGPANFGQVAALAGDPRVKYIEPDRVVSLVPPAGPPIVRAQLHTNDFETLTTGIDRVDAELNSKTDLSAIGIAILDTGIWLQHSDLNVAGNVTFVTGTKSGNDDNGHGTHVAGIAAAKTGDNRGVRGVAPNARLYAVKVLNKNGSGFLSWVIAGVDWVTKNAADKRIHVANMSLGFEGTSTALDDSIHKMVTTANVATAVAAGNSGKNASTFSPANHPDVITVSAMGDSDGKCGARGGATSDGPDDTFATFSNFGAVIELAAPGVDILSTWKGDRNNPGGLYATASGTSMSSPHGAGGAAQYIASNPGASPSAVRTALIERGTPQDQACGIDATGRERGGFTGDKDSTAEPLLDAASL